MNDLFEYMDRYFNGELSPEQKEAFEKRCVSDRAFAEDLAVYITIEDYLKQKQSNHKKQDTAASKEKNSISDRLSFDNHIKATHADNIPLQDKSSIKLLQSNTVGKFKKLNNWKKLLVAAAVLGVVSISVLWMFKSHHNNNISITENKETNALHNKTANTPASRIPHHGILPKPDSALTNIPRQEVQASGVSVSNYKLPDRRREQLFRENFTPDELPLQVPPLLQEPMADYKAGKFADALTGFDAAPLDIVPRGMADKRPISFYIHYYKAQSFLATNQPSKAIIELQKVLHKSPDRFFRIKVSWYLALAYFRNGDINEATPLLQQVAGNSNAGHYQQKAVNLLKQISDQ